jgi:4-amino-4-deoxy-L-arabinose transferase-like glycosyltransferase
MKKILFTRRFFDLDVFLLLSLALMKLLIHFYTNGNYGIHRDEFLYLAMGDHLSWGYLEVPPSIAVFAKLTQWLWGDSLFAIRFFPAVLGSLVVLLTGLIVWELGGNRFAMLLAGVSMIIAPVYLRAHTLFQPVVFDQFYWVLGFFLLILLINNVQRHYLWVLLGVVGGLGLLNKYSMFFWGFALLVGLLLTPHRKHLLTRWLWIAAATAFVLFLPNLIWQISHGWPVFEHIRKLNEYQFSNLTHADFLLGQVLIMHPATFPVWLLGIGYFFFKKIARPFRILGWMYLTILLVLIIFTSKHYYLAPAYPVLLAGPPPVLDQSVYSRFFAAPGNFNRSLWFALSAGQRPGRLCRIYGAIRRVRRPAAQGIRGAGENSPGLRRYVWLGGAGERYCRRLSFPVAGRTVRMRAAGR